MSTPLDRRLRRLDLSSAQAARLLRVPTSTLSQWRWGRNPTPRWAMRFLALYVRSIHLQGLSQNELARIFRGKHLFLLTDHVNELSKRKRIPVRNASKALAIEHSDLLRTCQIVPDDCDVALLRHAETGKLLKSAIRIE